MSQTTNQILETLLNRKDIGEDSAYNLMTELAEGVVRRIGRLRPHPLPG